MDEIFGLKFNFSYVHTSQKNIEIPLCAKKFILITEFVIRAKILPFHKVREKMMHRHREISDFFLGHFSPSILGYKR